MRAGETLSPGDVVTVERGHLYRMRAASIGIALGIAAKTLRSGEIVALTDDVAITGVFYLLSWEENKRYIKSLVSSLEATWRKLYGTTR